MDETVAHALIAAVIVFSALTLVLSVLVIATLRHMAFLFEVLDPVLRFSTRVSVLQTGKKAPELELENLAGAPVSTHALSGSYQFFLITQPQCKPCDTLLHEGRQAFITSPAHGWKPVVVILGKADDARRMRDELLIPSDIAVLVDSRLKAISVWGIQATPFAVAIDEEGTVRGTFSMLTGAELTDLLGRPASEVSRRPQRGPLISGDLTYTAPSL